MSWSINISGKKEAVLRVIAQKFDDIKYLTDPTEEALKNSLRDAAIKAVEYHPDDKFIIVEASGSCNPNQSQTVSLKVNHMGGYVE